VVRRFASALSASACLLPSCFAADRLLSSTGATQIEGASGGGLSPWAVIAGSGNGGREKVGASAFATALRTVGAYTLRSDGGAVGIGNRVELSVARWRADRSTPGPVNRLRMDVFGAKWRLWGEQTTAEGSSTELPNRQIAVGLQYKRNRSGEAALPVAARRSSDIDYYFSATQTWPRGLGEQRPVLANLTLRATRANQYGLLGFGGDRGDSRRLEPELSVATRVQEDMTVGVEWRSKTALLHDHREQSAKDLFISWQPHPHWSATASFVDLGTVGDQAGQRGFALSMRLRF
jgi:hypothetical protein